MVYWRYGREEGDIPRVSMMERRVATASKPTTAEVPMGITRPPTPAPAVAVDWQRGSTLPKLVGGAQGESQLFVCFS